MEFKDLADRFAKLQKKFEEGTGQAANISIYFEQGVWVFGVACLEFSATVQDSNLESAIVRVEELIFSDSFLNKAEEIKLQIEEKKKKYIQAEREQNELFTSGVKNDKFLLN